MKISLKIKFAIIAIVAGLVAFYGFSFSFGLIKSYVEKQETENARILLSTIDKDLQNQLKFYKDDIRLLSNIYSISEFSPEEDRADEIARIEELFLFFAREHREYFRIRYIDETGQEVVRIDRDDKNSIAKIVSPEGLTSKKDKYYFQEATNLLKNEVHISEIDLNLDGTEVQVPYTPMIRFTTPIFDKEGKNKGIVVSNVFADDLLEIVKLSPYSSTFLVDQDGYYIHNSEDSTKEWGKSLGLDMKLEHFTENKAGYDNVFRYVNFVEKDDFSDNGNREGKYFDYKINYTDINPDRYWVLSVFMDNEYFFAEYYGLQNSLIIFNVFVIFLIIFGFLIFVDRLLNPMKKIMKTIEYLNIGRYDVTADVKSKDEFGQFAKNLNSLIKKVAQDEEEKYNFIKSASHQLRTPASVVRMSIDALIDELKKSKQYTKNKELIENIADGNKTLITVIGDITKFLEIGENYFATHLKRVKLREITERIVESFAEQIDSKKLDIKIRVNKNIMVLVEESLMKNAIFQIVSNAIEYSNLGGKITISAKKIKGYIEVSIADTGIGIPAKEQVHIFDRFFRAENAYRKKNVGSGLGLVIARAIIQGHGGKIRFKSRQNKGTTFTFTIVNPSK